MSRTPFAAMRDTVAVFLACVLACAPLVVPAQPMGAVIYLFVAGAFSGFTAIVLVLALRYRRVTLDPLRVVTVVGFAVGFALAGTLLPLDTALIRRIATSGAGGLGLAVGLLVAYHGILDSVAV